MLKFVVTVSLLAALRMTDPAFACAVVSRGAQVLMTGEQAIIVWDSETRTEHFIRQATFASQEPNFGFIVPVPAVPDFGEVDANAFSRLAHIAFPKPEGGGFGGGRGGGGGVQVLKVEQVGDYKATVLRGTDGPAVAGWMKENGFSSRPALTAWLDHYIAKGWGFAALKYEAAKSGPTGTKALRISFKIDKPFYPYKMPKDSWQSHRRKKLTVYFLAKGKAEATLDNLFKPWDARTAWVGTLNIVDRAPLCKEIGLKDKDLPDNAVLTIFQNATNKDGFGSDLVFSSATR